MKLRDFKFNEIPVKGLSIFVGEKEVACGLIGEVLKGIPHLADFTVVSVPSYVAGECPYCKEDFEIDYNDFGNSDYLGDWKGEIIECPYCEKEIIVDDVDWD